MQTAKNNKQEDLPGLNPTSFKLIKTSIGFLFFIALIGATIRCGPFLNINLPYKNFIHAHSHGAFLGWLYLGILAIALGMLKDKNFSKSFYIILKADIIILVIMVPCFMIYGYNLLSIILSSLHIFFSWYLAVMLIRCYGVKSLLRFNVATSYPAMAWLFMIVSGIFPLALGWVIRQYGNGSTMYFNTIYSYLHFQYNGYFIFIILALLNTRLKFNERIMLSMKIVYFAMVVTTIVLVVNSYLWAKPPLWMNVVSIIAAIMQLFALGIYAVLFSKFKITSSGLFNRITSFVVTGLFIKAVMQVLASFPELAIQIGQNRYLVLFYLHYVLLGIVSIPLLIFMTEEIKVYSGKIFNVSIIVILIGFILTEGILFLKAMETINTIPVVFNFSLWLALFSCIFPLAIFSFWTQIKSVPK